MLILGEKQDLRLYKATGTLASNKNVFYINKLQEREGVCQGETISDMDEQHGQRLVGEWAGKELYVLKGSGTTGQAGDISYGHPLEGKFL